MTGTRFFMLRMVLQAHRHAAPILRVVLQSHRHADLPLNAPITTAADDIHKYFFIVFLEKIRLDISSESSARQRIHMENQVLVSSNDKNKKLKCRLLQF